MSSHASICRQIESVSLFHIRQGPLQMIDMTTWREIQVDVLDDLLLDPLNVRLGMSASTAQPDILQALFAEERALELVDSIVKVGYLTNEVPIVVKRKGKWVVAEGNRRVAALKAIQNPHLAAQFQGQISKLVSGMTGRAALRKINVKIAPNQRSANQLIAALHTGNIRFRWAPPRQAEFFQAQLDTGMSFKDLVAEFPTIDVRDFVFRSGILGLFKSVSYTDPSLTTFLASRTFPSTTLSRVYESQAFSDLVGLGFNSRSGRVTIKVSSAKFAEMAENILAGIRAKDINTRTIGKTDSPRFIKLIDELTDIRDRGTAASTSGQAQGGMQGSSNSNVIGTQKSKGGAATSSSTNSGATVAPGRRTHPIRNLPTGHLAVPQSFPQAVTILFGELSLVDIQRTPNIAFDALRTVLEKTIKAYAEALGEDIRNTANQNGYVQLSHCLTWLHDYFKTNGPRALVQVVQQVQSGKLSGSGYRGYVSSMSHMNAANHNHHITIAPDEVLECWNTMDSLLREMLKV